MTDKVQNIVLVKEEGYFLFLDGGYDDVSSKAIPVGKALANVDILSNYIVTIEETIDKLDEESRIIMLLNLEGFTFHPY